MKVIKGRAAIAEAVGENYRDIPALVRDKGLPAYKTDGTKEWRAVDVDLEIWMLEQADMSLPEDWKERRRKYKDLFSSSTEGKAGG